MYHYLVQKSTQQEAILVPSLVAIRNNTSCCLAFFLNVYSGVDGAGTYLKY